MEAMDRVERANAGAETAKAMEGSSASSWKEALLGEVRSHPFGYVVLGLFVMAGPLLFPQAPPAVAAVGGLAFGLYAALCAVPQKFL
jgi:hypothetical protein